MKHIRNDFVKHRMRLLWVCLAFVAVLAGAERWYVLSRGATSARPAVPAQPAQDALAPGQAAPLEGMVICLDPGHGGYDGGARAKDSGQWEKEINLAVAQKTAAALKSLGAQVVMTRDGDYDLTEAANGANTKKRRDMKARIDIAKEAGAQLLLSIHMNEYRSASSSGPQVFYRKGQEASRLLAGCMQESLILGLEPVKKREAMAGDYYILSLDIPSVLVECGFISNSREEALLLTADYQEKLAKAIAQGVVCYRDVSARAAEETPS